MTMQPGPYQQPTATPAGQPTIDDNARKFLADLESVYAAERTQHPTAIRIEDPAIPSWQDGARIGTTPPVTDQPGTRRPPMSQKAVDLNTTILTSSVFTAVLGGAATAVLWGSGHADPTVIRWVCGCAVAFPAAVAIAFKSLMKSAKEVVQAAPPEIHQHYNGNVYQDQRRTDVHADTRGLIAITRNEIPPAPQR